ncbi:MULTISPECIES: small acid-soluble spore protein Tlp [Clostridium]|uniref:small acid-soluble spore protein Tlp n=1 Tax=Clostridium TaxID=1485 RepID=UPI001898114A|nr:MULTISPECIES: small acid-soluble spore protein Tlp [Clostridium]MCR1950800.1 small acid-soluble spore protein Tlp [Clostridium sp. DSM 100503]MDI9216644.1 small acid-soluble spore protein Tlp [Clostridium tertium]
MKNKPDDRSDNVERIQENINNVLENIHLANEMIDKTDDPKTIENLEERNERRERALKGLHKEIRDEAIANEIKSKVLPNENSYK